MKTNTTKNETLEALVYKRGSLKVLNQLLLPHEFSYESCEGVQHAFEFIVSMKVRGAPAIAITAALGLAVELHSRKNEFRTVQSLTAFLRDSLVYLGKSRPTAVNLFDAIFKLQKLISELENVKQSDENNASSMIETFILACETMLEKDISDNQAIGEFGMNAILHACSIKATEGAEIGGLNVLTHCNTGSLATAGYGTALGIIRSLHAKKALKHAFCTETRPYNQGARLTAFELVFEKIPSTLITDSMASFLMLKKNIHAVVVGADRVVNNGDTANKIGTYQLAIAAKYHNIPFFVAAPTTSLDLDMQTGAEIPVEERAKQELTHVAGIQIAASGIGVWNPGFDITPGELITGIVTEKKTIFSENGKYNLKEMLKA